MRGELIDIYEALLEHFGRQGWWPGESGFEMMVGAVLTQNTNWTNVEKAIANLKKHDRLSPAAIDRMDREELAELIRPAGYFNTKAKRLKNLVRWFCQKYQGSTELLEGLSVARLREELLSINGIGPETADSIILYALDKPTFVVDTYTCRILIRHGFIEADCGYEGVKDYCESHLPVEVELYNEFHALLVAVGKHHCKVHAQCLNCPLEQSDHYTDT